MSADSLDLMSEEEIAANIEIVKAATPKAFAAMKRENLHILRIADIAKYLNLPRKEVYKPKAARVYRQELSEFFTLWNSGQLQKTQVGHDWTITRRDPALAQVAPAPRTQARESAKKINMRCEVGPGGPRLKM
jgi:hypothetical protein